MVKSWVAEYLEKKKAKFRLVEHEAVYKPVDSARVRNVNLSQIAKALLYIIDDKPVLLILPGDAQVNEETTKKTLKAGNIRLSTKEEVKKFTNCEVGLVPPIIEKIKKIVDPSLLINKEVSFNAGIATAGIIITTNELLKILDDYETKSITSEKDIIIGMEIHVQLNTATKLFCSCPTQGNEEPNSRTCPTCLGMPGSKPVVNKKAIEYALKLALATKSKISPELIFSRKSYFYDDLAKNYQISQYEIPLAVKGKIKLAAGKEINLTRIHMEEDPAALVDPAGMEKSPYVLVDYNRSGNPLVEVVTEPELTSPEEARDFMKQLITILEYLEIFDVNNCIIKADANISIKESGYTRAEVKNITGFKEIERALKYEVERQKQDVKEGKKIVHETRAWDSERGITFSLRVKEVEEEYGYIIDPDLVGIELAQNWIKELEKTMPELADAKLDKFLKEHKIEETTAKVLAKDKELALMYEKVAIAVPPDLAAKWIRRELARVLNYHKKKLKDSAITETHLIDLLTLIEKKTITEKVAQKLIEELVEKPFDVKEYVKKQGLEAVSDEGEIEKFCKEAVKEASEAVEDYKKGNEKALHFIVGIVMKKSKGKADPDVVKKIFEKIL